MNKEDIPVITDREELYDKCENMEQLFDKYYLPLLDKHYSKTYKLQQENQELKKQLEEANEKIILLQASEPMLNYKKALEENQQKEFIEYMNKTIKELECDDVDDEEMKGYLIQRINTFKEILSKYKEIIGGNSNER